MNGCTRAPAHSLTFCVSSRLYLAQQQSAPSSQDAGVGSAADAASASAKPSEPSGATGAGNGELGGIPVAPQPPPSVVQPASSDGKSEGGYLSDTMDELKPRFVSIAGIPPLACVYFDTSCARHRLYLLAGNWSRSSIDTLLDRLRRSDA